MAKASAAKKPTTTEEALPKDNAVPAAKDAPTKKKVGVRGSTKFAAAAIITLLVDYNPKRAGSSSHGRFEKYEDGMTVEDAQKAGITAGDLLWDTKHGFIEIGEKYNDKAVVKSKPEPKPKAEKKEGKVEVKFAAGRPAKKAPPADEAEEENC